MTKLFCLYHTRLLPEVEHNKILQYVFVDTVKPNNNHLRRFSLRSTIFLSDKRQTIKLVDIDNERSDILEHNPQLAKDNVNYSYKRIV